MAAERLLALCPSGLVEEPDELTVYFPAADLARRAAVKVKANGDVALRPLAESSWGKWRSSFRTVAVSERLQVVPVYEAGAGPGTGAAITVLIEPGLAFGTGEHPTTLACLRYLERVVRPGHCVLDVGTGSGILAVAAALLGASEVVAIDLDPMACRAARTNLDLNPGAVGRVDVTEADAVLWLNRADAPQARVVTANLTSALLTLLAPGLARATAPGGWLIASGISWEERPGVEDALFRSGFGISGRTLEAGWATILAVRKGG